MKFWCTTDCIDSGDMTRTDKRGIPIRHNYRVASQQPYDIDEEQLRRLTKVGLFPECFDYAEDLAKSWVEAHNDELCDIVESRNFPPTPIGPVELNKPRLVRKAGRTLDQRVLGDRPKPEIREQVALKPREKGMSAEARKAAGDRMRAMHAAKKAEKAAV